MKRINSKAPVKCSRTVTVNASIEKVWTILTDISNWKTWQTDFGKSIMNGELKPGTTFDWESGGTKIHSALHTVEPFKYFGWTGKAYGLLAIHNWTLTETDGQTIVSVDESMEGFVAKLFRKSFNRNLEKGLQNWLSMLKQECEKQHRKQDNIRADKPGDSEPAGQYTKGRYSFLMSKAILLIAFAVFYGRAYSQFIVKDTLPASFEWSLHILDVPYMVDAAKTEAIRAGGWGLPLPVKAEARNYGNFYRNLSMEQSTEMARNLHGSLYFGHNVLWNNLIEPKNTKKYILNRFIANLAALGTDYLAIRLPYGFAFQHEEFHRAVMSARHVYSYDEVWKFGKGLDIAVTNVKDEDLIYLKSNHPADQVRLSAAGVEGEYAFMQRMREANFFRQTGCPFVGISLLGTLHAVNYVNLPFTDRFNSITDSILSHDRDNILARDFTGWDFSAWAYDLFTPDEPYEARGTWPGGIGIKRPVKESDLTPGMKDFLRETGNMQYLNFISPFMIGINRIQLKPGYFFNFALRSVPASFGYYAGGDFFLDFNDRQMMINLGINRSKSLTLPSLDVIFYNIIRQKDARFNTNISLSGWLQPKDQMFAAHNAAPGMSAGLQPRFYITRRFSLAADLSYKTKGWVFGNPYLDENFTFRLGFGINTR